MTPTAIAALIGASILILAITFFWLTRSRRRNRAVAYGAAQTGALIEILRDALHFMMGPLPLSISGPERAKKLSIGVHGFCGKQRKSTASVRGEGKRAWRARVRAVATLFDCAGATLHSSQRFVKIDRGCALP